MLADGVAHLRCPHCGRGLALDGAVLRCEATHAFDVARQGYVSLLRGDAGPGTGDTAAMVAAREAFLAAGHLDPVFDAVAGEVAAAAERAGPGCIVDSGAGTGRALARALEGLPGRAGIALDLSAPALRRAARAHPRIAAVRCDAWAELPLRDATAAAAMCVLAPRNGPELARVVRAGGALVVATPTERHAAELVGELGLLRVDPRKRERLDRALGGGFAHAGERLVEHPMSLGRAEAAALAAMGPAAHHVAGDELARRALALPEQLEVTASVRVSVHRRA